MDTGVVILLTVVFGVLALIVIPEVVDRKKIKKVVEIVKGIDEKVFLRTPLEKRVELKLADKERYDVSYHDFKQPLFIDLNQSKRIHKAAIVSEYHYTKAVIKYGDWKIEVLGDVNGKLKLASIYNVKIEKLYVYRISWYFEDNKVKNLTVKSKRCFYDDKKDKIFMSV
ncbi:hypothetical protein P3U36_07950 [Staphylococcus pseudintermedius]|uniref:hypothetical protein n=1 Tax=Staphylococcus pseudintermedius TaxID=283734 RepID=UPI002A32315D|nr:hypothetical protein [Staphylococcus pseudintermedius]EKH2203485.1 hypothetical protein [Staphylococcus pseudintermedius]WQL64611.1 hypothetical protein P3U36_07950 [Staphylococcus pseudintermedius]HAR6293716.1 hypothetical protein [Staphylococcus pseudintermedius]HDK5720120.1 hypothetical protein [Staphylococcus pseudintermedius]